MANVLVNEDGLTGQYVAMVSFSDNTVIAHGPTAALVLEESLKQGVNDPVIFYVPDPNAKFVY